MLVICRADLERLNKIDAAAFCGTIGPNDALFLPAGSLVSHRVHASDVLGVRVGLVAEPMMKDLETVLGFNDKNAAVQEAVAFLKAAAVENPPEDLPNAEAAAAEEKS